jgi:hypothetical protein
MARLFQNFIEGVTDTTLTTGTTLSGSFLASLPQVITPDILVLVLDPEGSENGPEVVHVTAHSTSATSATILRAQEGTAQVTHTAPAKVVGSWTKAAVDALVAATTAAQADAVAAQADADTNTSALTGHVGLGGTVHPEVIAAGAAGFLSGADKTKLNGVEALADVTSTHNAATATRLAAGRTIALTGGVTGTSGSFDGSGDASIAATVTDDSHTHDTRYYTEGEVGSILASYALLAGAIFAGGTSTAPLLRVGDSTSGLFNDGSQVGYARAGVPKVYSSATETYVATDLLAAVGSTAGSDTVRRFDAGGGWTKFLYFSSSKDVKKDIVDADLVEAARALRPVRFKSKLEADEGKSFIGFIAEEVSETIPLAAIHDSEGKIRSYSETAVLAASIALAQDNARRLDAIEASLGL